MNAEEKDALLRLVRALARADEAKTFARERLEDPRSRTAGARASTKPRTEERD
jgi:hypothetical protein